MLRVDGKPKTLSGIRRELPEKRAHAIRVDELDRLVSAVVANRAGILRVLLIEANERPFESSRAHPP
jgi:hypothetical protein